MRIAALIAGIFLMAASWAMADVPASQPALSADSTLDQILDALDARGQNLTDFVASVILADTNGASGDETKIEGKVYFQRKTGGDTRIHVKFDRRDEDTRLIPMNHQYTLDDGWLIERDYKEKKEIKWQVRKPGEKMDMMRLGEGPFPLPIGQKKEDVKAQFAVAKIGAAKDDPANTVHVQLTPKAGTSLARKFATIDVWVDLATAMPRRIKTGSSGNPDAQDIKTTDLTDVKINAGVGDGDFAQDKLPDDWTTVVQSYKGN
jgi:outer membrane lipoprotein-sorting protein